MKRISIILCLIGFLLFGCTASKPVQEDAYYILFATPLNGHIIWEKAHEGFQDACEELKIHYDWIGPNTIDTARMNEVIETGLLMKADGIITQGVVDEALINRAHQLQIPMVLVDSDQPKSERFLYMGKNFKQQAELLLEDIQKKYGKDKFLKIAIQVAEKNFAIAQEQIEEIYHVFANHPGGYKIVSVSESKSDLVRAKREWSQVMETHTDLNVAINFAGESAASCVEAVKHKGRSNQVLIYGVDDMKSTIDLIENEEIEGSIVTSFYDYGYQSVKAIYDYLETGKKPEEIISYPNLLLVTKENIETYEKDLRHEKD